MKRLNVLSYFIVISVAILLSSHGFPLSEEDDEYDDDPELPDRKAVMQKFQEEMEKLIEKQQEQDQVFSTTTTTTTTPKPKVPKQKKKWAVVQDIRGYQVLTDGAKIHTELIKTRPMLRIRIDMPDTIRHVEKTYDKRFVELKIRNWDKVHRVHIKVPFGFEPEDLKIGEMKDHIDIVAPVYAELSDELDELEE